MNWYAKTISHQGLILDEDTGASIAVTYDKDHAPLVAAAPKMLSALKQVEQIALGLLNHGEVDKAIGMELLDAINTPLSDAQEVSP